MDKVEVKVKEVFLPVSVVSALLKLLSAFTWGVLLPEDVVEDVVEGAADSAIEMAFSLMVGNSVSGKDIALAVDLVALDISVRGPEVLRKSLLGTTMLTQKSVSNAQKVAGRVHWLLTPPSEGSKFELSRNAKSTGYVINALSGVTLWASGGGGGYRILAAGMGLSSQLLGTYITALQDKIKALEKENSENGDDLKLNALQRQVQKIAAEKLISLLQIAMSGLEMASGFQTGGTEVVSGGMRLGAHMCVVGSRQPLQLSRLVPLGERSETAFLLKSSIPDMSLGEVGSLGLVTTSVIKCISCLVEFRNTGDISLLVLALGEVAIGFGSLEGKKAGRLKAESLVQEEQKQSGVVGVADDCCSTLGLSSWSKALCVDIGNIVPPLKPVGETCKVVVTNFLGKGVVNKR